MDGKNHGLRPSKREYEQFSRKLAESKGNNFGPAVHFILLSFIGFPLIGVIVAILLVKALGANGFLPFIGSIFAYLIGMIFFGFKAYQGIGMRQVRVIPPSRIKQNSETSYVGGKMKEIATGRDAIAAGILFFIFGFCCLLGLIKNLLILFSAIN